MGGGTLNKEQKEQIEKFYAPFFKVNFIAHTFYLEKTGKFYVEYIPDEIWYSYIDPYFNNWKLDKYIDNKCYYPRMFPDVKMAALYFYKLNDFWLNNENQIISFKLVCDFLSSKECYIKIADSISGCGNGVVYYNPTLHDKGKLMKALCQNANLVVQEPIRQHSNLASLNSSSVNTIRLLSLLKRDGSVKIYSSVLRMGRKGSKVDNASQGGITCGIKEDGRLKNIGYTRFGECIECHPDSKVRFEDVEIPNFSKVKDLIYKAHQYVPDFRLVSWDVSIDHEGEPVLIEINPAYGELDFHQLNNGPIFKEDTLEILSEVFKK